MRKQRLTIMITQLLMLLGASLMTTTFAQPSTDSLSIKIGQMIMVGVPGTNADSATLAALYQGKVGAVLLFEKNISPIHSYARLKKMISRYKKASALSLLVAIDQEGGKVNRLKEKYGFPRLISAVAMGGSIDSVRFYGKINGVTLAGLGININLAPVVDLSVNPSNPVIAKLERSFSADGDSVARYAKAFIQAQHREGVLTTLKHFPGHGSSDRDTHLGMADVTKSWTDQELKPYKLLIDKGYVDAIMTAHIINRQLDTANLPGTLSKNILNDLLRSKLGYAGVIISDDMQMHAITKHFGFQEAVLLAIQAGVDILTFSNNITGSKEYTADIVHAMICSFVAKGIISESRIDQSFKRIMRLKKKQNHLYEDSGAGLRGY